MELFIGFLIGIVASIIASFAFKAFESALPLSKQKRLFGFLKNPSLFMRIRFNTEEKIKELIVKLFNAWETKDPEEYLSCWSDDAIRVVGTNSPIKENKKTIKTKFMDAIEKYSTIKVDAS